MPPPRVRPVSDAAAKWVRRAAGAGQDYQSGVTGSGGRWAAGATAGGQNYRTAVVAAAGAGRFERGVQRAGAARYERGAVEKGVPRYAQGVAVAEGDYSSAVQPFLQAIGSLDLPARGPRGAAGNLQRVAVIATALRKLAEGR